MKTEICVSSCDFCGKSHILKPYTNNAGDEVIRCPETGKVVTSDYYGEE